MEGEKDPFARSRKILHEGTSRQSNARDIQQLKGKGIPSRPADSFSETTLKREMYGISSFILQDVYENVKNKLYDENGNAIPFIIPIRKNNEPEDRLRLDALTQNNVLIALDAVRGSFAIHMNRALREWIEAASTPDSDASAQSQESKALNRLEYLLAIERAYHGSLKESEYVFLSSGAGTAAFTSWDIIRSIPIAYYRQYSRCISSDEFSTLMRSGERLAVELSSMHLEKFIALRDSNQGEPDLKSNVEIAPDFFRIESTPEGNIFAFDEQVLKQWNAALTMEPLATSRIGCPARDIRVENERGEKTNLVSVAYQYTESLANRLLLPNLEQYTKAVMAESAS